jgi:Ser/Thr protein kinase RdoA (MazF antagonist)
MTASILSAYGLHDDSFIEPLTSGLINRTWKVTDGSNQFILQQINIKVFKKPYALAENISMIDHYLKEHSPQYVFVSPISTIYNEDLYHEKEEGYFRLFPFIQGSHTIDVVKTPDQAFEAAFQFGKFTQLLSGFDATKLHITIPDFHNLTLRYRQFEQALKNGNPVRIKQSQPLSDTIKKHVDILTEFERIKKSKNVKQRVMHHDTKISNVLFDSSGKGICIIDLDTIMPGYFISDVGDMMRTYLSPANEEVKDFHSIDLREDFFRAIVQGYIMAMGNELTAEERGLILYSGLFLTYMQAIRFLTDYYNNDIYYGARYEEHNYFRAGNQLQLLKILTGKTEILQKIVLEESRHITQTSDSSNS